MPKPAQSISQPRSIDVLGLGAVAVDDLIYVEAYPPADVKTPVLRRERQCGGLTATALVAAARLGAKCAYAGVLGNDVSSEFVLDTFRAEKVDVSGVLRRRGTGPVQSAIVVDTTNNTRNIFGYYKNAVGAAARWPSETVIRSAKVLFVDHFGVPGMIRAARIARRAGVPVVADFERDPGGRFDELFGLVDHLILGEKFACKRTGESSAENAVRRLWNDDRAVVAVTCGACGCWFVDKANSSQPRHIPAFRVDTVDTTGCGDVFHGAYAASLARGLSLEERLRFASAAAAIKATHRGGQAGIPSLREVMKFLQSHRERLEKF
jgi:sulfofructose kinase